ncbi:Spy/CpxP family protein refolding chaperone [Telmatospirillum sp.]|uniref:Spy/CpxP family protein refolding chaperone n=1 Tax=Telmatospirillum sp. TaxID=2079197 RepID=UPI00284DC0B8|nr:Spy/CpxP family protein refolding chaperone [Telmatospirillum sp.]MDR3435047.1 Spy/CpxP family protein refolding chaperone [Telmatospirillum sp.]
MKRFIPLATTGMLTAFIATAAAETPQQQPDNAIPAPSASPEQNAPMEQPVGGVAHGNVRAPHFNDPAQIAALKARLAIRPDQENTWNAYVKTLRDATAALRSSMAPDAMQSLSPEQQEAAITQMRTQQQSASQAIEKAAETLARSLTEQQRAIAQNTLPGLAMPAKTAP